MPRRAYYSTAKLGQVIDEAKVLREGGITNGNGRFKIESVVRLSRDFSDMI
jgi:hypothetical protein